MAGLGLDRVRPFHHGYLLSCKNLCFFIPYNMPQKTVVPAALDFELARLTTNDAC